ncbi:NlpC/P60 family protein [Saxibacter everestensis]|uniref:NlpC/P60 family protein n=1 Tax=Saxibacter everestensis TaxID=2909229 RepID=UPI0032E35C8E
MRFISCALALALGSFAITVPAFATEPSGVSAAAVTPDIENYSLTAVAASGLKLPGADDASDGSAAQAGGAAKGASFSGSLATGTSPLSKDTSVSGSDQGSKTPAPKSAPSETTEPKQQTTEPKQESTEPKQKSAPTPDAEPSETPSEEQEPETKDGAEIAALTPSISVGGGAPNLVGVTWSGSSSADIEVRQRSEDGTWLDWQPLEVENAADGAERANQRAGTEPFVVTNASDIQVRALGSSAPAQAKVAVIDPGTSSADAASVSQNAPAAPASLADPAADPAEQGAADAAVASDAMAATAAASEAVPAAAAPAAVAKPAIGSRKSWGADEGIRRGSPSYGTVKAAVVHHTAGSSSYTAAQVPSIIRGVYAYHVKSRGWNDIGYNIIADKYGRLWEGRYGGLDKAVSGAQVEGYNSTTFGISTLGTFTGSAPPAASITAVNKAIAWKLSLAGVKAGATTTLNGKSRPTIIGHRDIGQTTCPGAAYYSKLPGMRTAIKSIQGGSSSTPDASTSKIAAKYKSLGGTSSFLGSAAGKQFPVAGGWGQKYQHGYIYYSSAYGAHEVHGRVGSKFASAKGPAGILGFPKTDETCGLKGGGCYQTFQKGGIHYTYKTGARITTGAVRTSWQNSGWENGVLGYPKGDQKCGLKNSGCYQTFEKGSIHWTAKTGARITTGAFRDAWSSAGWENGTLGYPTGNQKCGLKGNGCYQSFQGGSIHYTAKTGARITTGVIRAEWEDAGWENGKLGYPTANMRCGLKDAGCRQTFQYGAIHWTKKFGSRIEHGAISAKWLRMSRESGRLGYPVRDEVCGLKSNGCYQMFERGSIHWTSKSNAHFTNGAIQTRWAAQGYENGKLGYPTNDETCGLKNRGCYQKFQGGSVHWSSKSNAWITRGAIQEYWGKLKYENGRLGYPVGNESCNGAKTQCEQKFQGGTLLWKKGKSVTEKKVTTDRASQVLAIAKSYLGTKYVYGGSTPSGWDCSGYTSYVYRKVGVNLPRTSGAQAKAGRVVSASAAKPGDLVYRPGHIGIYAGKGMMYDAGSTRSNTAYRSFSWMGNVTFIRVL